MIHMNPPHTDGAHDPREDLFKQIPDPATIRDITASGLRSRSSLNRDIASGRLPAYKIGKRLFVRRADLIALVEPVRSAS